MLIFWVVAGLLAAASAGLILFRAARASAAPQGGDPSAVLYRRQLAEIDELAERGLIGEAERRSAHAEAARRLLTAAETPAAAWRTETRSTPILLAATAAPALALGLYLALGSPGLRDQPYEDRLAAWRSASLETLAPAQIAAVLKATIAERPSDPEGYRLLALAEGASENPAGAVRAMRRAVALAPERTELRRLLGEALVFQAGGKVEPPAREVFQEVLRREPGDVTARFYLGLGQSQAGERTAAAAAFRALLAEIPADDARRPAVEAALAEAEGRPQPRALPPEQMTAILGMVEGLAARLQQNPDDPEGWVRLVRAYAVLGDAAKRDAALAQARARYAGQAPVLRQLEDAARTEPMR